MYEGFYKMTRNALDFEGLGRDIHKHAVFWRDLYDWAYKKIVRTNN